jgi:hypothetical protein
MEKFMTFLILAQLDNCSPETKFFLLRFYMTNAYDLPDILKVDDVAKTLTINRSLTGKALQELTQAGYLSVSAVSQTGKGRPKSLYDVTEKMSTMLEAANSKLALHQDLIHDLIAPDKSSDSGERRHPLKAPSRLLLATLLALSDKKGVARDVRTSALAGYTGMGTDRIRNHVAKLHELGYIQSIVAGVSSSKLFGTVGSAYILNLKHECYGDLARAGCLWLISLGDEEYRQLPFEAHRVIKLARSAKGESLQSLGRTQRELEDLRVKLDPSSFHSIASLFHEKTLYRLAPRLQFELEITASAILSDLWEGLSSEAPEVNEQAQEEYLGSAVAPEKLFKARETDRRSLLSLLYQVSWGMAKDRYEIIRKSVNTPGNYLLHHPPGTRNPMTGLYGSRHFAVESIKTSSKPSNIFIVTTNPSLPNSTEFKKHNCEQLTNATYNRFGLVGKPTC